MDRRRRFILGVILGVIVAAITLAIFSGAVAPSWLSSTILSAITYLGIGLVAAGYVTHEKNRESIAGDFLLGFGVGLILIWFLIAGSSYLTY